MRGVFGLLLIGSGVVLGVALFTGRIKFNSQQQQQSSSTNPTAPVSPNSQGNCPPGYTKMSNGQCLNLAANGV